MTWAPLFHVFNMFHLNSPAKMWNRVEQMEPTWLQVETLLPWRTPK